MSEVAPAPAPAPDAPVVPAAAPAPAPAPEAPAPEAPKPDRTFTQAELDDIVERRLAKERRKREDIERRLKITEELHLKGREQAQPQDQPRDAAAGEPRRDQEPWASMSYETFLEAKAEWRADRKVDQKFQEREAKDRERQTQTQHETQREAFRKAMKDSAKEIEDFDDVIGDIKADDPVANVSASAIEAADAPGKMLHYLAKHPEEAERIASLSPGKQAREILRLEEKLAKPPVKPSKAPEPIEPVGGKSTPADDMPNAKTEPEKWLKWRTAQIANARKAGMRAS